MIDVGSRWLGATIPLRSPRPGSRRKFRWPCRFSARRSPPPRSASRLTDGRVTAPKPSRRNTAVARIDPRYGMQLASWHRTPCEPSTPRPPCLPSGTPTPSLVVPFSSWQIPPFADGPRRRSVQRSGGTARPSTSSSSPPVRRAGWRTCRNRRSGTDRPQWLVARGSAATTDPDSRVPAAPPPRAKIQVCCRRGPMESCEAPRAIPRSDAATASACPSRRRPSPIAEIPYTVAIGDRRRQFRTRSLRCRRITSFRLWR